MSRFRLIRFKQLTGKVTYIAAMEPSSSYSVRYHHCFSAPTEWEFLISWSQKGKSNGYYSLLLRTCTSVYT